MSNDAKTKQSYSLYDKAIEELERCNYNQVLKIATKLHGNRFTGAFELEARARYEMGEAQEATRILETGLRKFPTCYTLASYLGEFQSNQGHYQLAIEAFEKARSGDQDTDSYADLNIGVCYSRMEMHDRAAEYFAKVDFSPDCQAWLLYWVCVAKNLWRRGYIDQFLRACDEGITLANRERSPGVKKQAAWLYAYRAEYYSQQCKPASAEQDLRASEILDRHNEQYLRAFRVIRGEYAEEATRFMVLLEGTTENAPGLKRKMGMFNRFEIIAKSEDDLVPFARVHAEPWQQWERVSEILSRSSVTDVHTGVVWFGEGLTLYGKTNWLDRLKAGLTGRREFNQD